MDATWRGAIKQGVASITGAILINYVDPLVVVYSTQWFRHIGICIVGMFIIQEAKYWNEWAGKLNGGQPLDANGHYLSPQQHYDAGGKINEIK